MERTYLHASAAELRSPAVWVIACLLFPVSAVMAAEEDSKKVRISSFAGWKYAATDDNTYLEGTEDGNYENVNFAVSLSSAPVEKLRISGQLELHSTPEEDEELEVEIDYIFASWKFSDRLNMKLGRAKHTFGIYSEVFDVGTLRPFFDLPQSVYGPAGVAGENYDGIGWGLRHSAKGWDVELDVYGGSLNFEATEPWAVLEDADSEEEEEELEEARRVRDMVGARLTLRPPVPGLSFGVSSYTGTADAEDVLETSHDAEELRHTVIGAHFDYEHDKWTLRGEYVFLDAEDELEHDGFYVELGYRVTQHWQVAARLDHSDVDVFEVDLDELDSVAEHRDLGLGINYWFNSHLVVKLAVHSVDGNRFAFPEELGEAELDEIDDETSLVQFGVQFSF